MPETFQRILYKTSQELHKLYWLCVKKRGVVCALKTNKHILCIFEKKHVIVIITYFIIQKSLRG